ncbi:uncharacterized protein LOC119167809 isoform X3 [Rhipicephalus microplus]
MDCRSKKQLINRYHWSLYPNMQRGRWSAQEDVMLLVAVKLCGDVSWSKVASMVPGRTHSQCRDRYMDNFAQQFVLGPFTSDEDCTLLQLVQKYGAGHWAMAARDMPWRASNTLLMRYRRLYETLRTKEPTVAGVERSLAVPVAPMTAVRCARLTGMDKRMDLYRRIRRLLNTDVMKRAALSLVKNWNENVSRETCMRLYRKMLQFQQGTRPPKNSQMQGRSLTKVIAKYAQPLHQPMLPSLAACEHQEWQAVANVLHDLHGLSRPPPNPEVEEVGTVPIFEKFFSKEVLGVPDAFETKEGCLVLPLLLPNELLGCLLRAAIKQANKDLEASHNGTLQQQHQKEKDHKKLRFQYSDQSKGLAQYWNDVTNFPAFSTDPMLVVAPASPCKEMWSDVARKSDSANIQCHSALSVTPKVAETDTAHGYPSLPITAVACTRAPAVTVFAQVKRHPVRAPALVGGVWMQHKVKKTGRTAVPLCSAAFEQSPPSDCGPLDACGVTSTVSPQSEGVVLRKGSTAADTSASTPRDDPRVEKKVRVENRKGHSNKKPVSPALVSGASVHHKVTKTGRTAVPLCSAAFEQSPPSDCGPPDACGVTSTVSFQSEGVVLCKDSSAAYTSAFTPRGDPRVEKGLRVENRTGHSNKKPVSPALVSGASVHHKVTKTGRTAVPLCSAAFEQSPPSDCGPPDACGVTSTVSFQSEGVVLCKGSSAADTSAFTPRGDPRVEKGVRVENRTGHSNKKPVAPALVSGASVHHKVTKTGRTAVPLFSAACEQSPPSDCGPPDACGITSTVSPQSEGVVLCKGSSAADTSASTPRGEQKATSAELSHSHICTGGGNLSLGSTFSTYKEFKASFEGWKSEGFHPMRIEKSNKNPLCTEKDLNKADFPYVRVKFVCCHAGHPNPR